MKRIIENKARIILAGAVLLFASLSCQFVENLFSQTGDDTPSTQLIVQAEKGGTVTSLDGRLNVEIPAGALAEDTEISIEIIPPEELPEELQEWEPIGSAYRLEPDGLKFQEPIKLTMQIDEEQLSNIEPEEGYSSFMIMSLNSDGELDVLENLETQFSETQGVKVSGYTDHFSHDFISQGYMYVSWNVLDPLAPVGITQFINILIHNMDVDDDIVFRNPSVTYSCTGNISCEKEKEEKSITITFKRWVPFRNSIKCKEKPGGGDIAFEIKALREHSDKFWAHDVDRWGIVLLPPSQHIDCFAVFPESQPPSQDQRPTPTPESLTEWERAGMRVTWDTDNGKNEFRVGDLFNLNLKVRNTGDPPWLLSNITADFDANGDITLSQYTDPFKQFKDRSAGQWDVWAVPYESGDQPGSGTANVVVRARAGEDEKVQNPELLKAELRKKIECVVPPEPTPTFTPPSQAPDLKTSYVPNAAGGYTIYAKVTGSTGAKVVLTISDVNLMGGKKTRKGEISEVGYIQMEWNVFEIESYKIEGTVGDVPVSVSVRIEKPEEYPDEN